MSTQTVAYLSTAWIEAADELLRVVVMDPLVDDPGLSIETAVTHGPDEWDATGFVVELRGASLSARRRRPGEASTVRFTQTYETACAVARGELSAQAAFLAADIGVGGDVSVLIANAGLIERIGDALAPLRARTTYAPADA